MPQEQSTWMHLVPGPVSVENKFAPVEKRPNSFYRWQPRKHYPGMVYPMEKTDSTIVVTEKQIIVDEFAFNKGPIEPAVRKKSHIFV